MRNTRKQAQQALKTCQGLYKFFSLPAFSRTGIKIDHLPFSIKILLENALRNCDGYKVTSKDIEAVAHWSPQTSNDQEIIFKPGRVVLQDFTGVPCVVDLAVMRDAMKRLGGDAGKVNPQIPCDLIIDHSIQTDFAGTKDAFRRNLAKEFLRNRERYEFLKWGQKAFKNFRVIPPATGIIHQINLEYLAQGVLIAKQGKDLVVSPDSVIGTDSHTTMINGLGVVGWGVGGIEAEAVMLGEPINMLMPQVIGFHLKGRLSEPATPTDLVLTIVEILRKEDVVGKFVEFFGEGLKGLSLPVRAMIANMCPEYGATMGLFPVDAETLAYYRLTGRPKAQVDLIERYYKEQGIFAVPGQKPASYTKVLALDLATVEPCLAGPKRPQDRIGLGAMKQEFHRNFAASHIKDAPCDQLSDGSVVIASITSCTNTSDPYVMIGAGLLAKKALAKGLAVKPFTKTSLAPGSQVATQYLKKSGLLAHLEKCGFSVVGYGCLTCIGNSGPLDKKISEAIREKNLIVASVLSGNRNFEGRVHPQVKANYLASPLLVVAYALAGNVKIDLVNEPLGRDSKGHPVFLKDVWPSRKEIEVIAKKYLSTKLFRSVYRDPSRGPKEWRGIAASAAEFFPWRKTSHYIQPAPFLANMDRRPTAVGNIVNARVLAMFKDSITTDHISPAGAISPESPAGKYLLSLKIKPEDFNSYGSRRGNDRIMVRGTFANTRLKNLLVPGSEGSWTVHFPSQRKVDIFSAAMLYQKAQTPLIVIAGKEYGTGSSRDWAAKGPALLGVKAVLAESFERIHRSNLIGMGILPLEFKPGQTRETLGIQGDETFDILGLGGSLEPRQEIQVVIRKAQGEKRHILVCCRIDTRVEIDYYRQGGVLQTVLRNLLTT